MYKLSRNYKKLFQMICDGHVVPAFVDYDIDDDSVCRDICKVERLDPYDIFIGVRGHSYGTIYPFMERHGAEENVFIRRCESVNLEWIEP